MIVNNTKEILRINEQNAKKKFGQNFITSKSILEHIVKVSSLSKDDYVIEIGPGLGSLTEFLALGAKEVIAYEIDLDMVNILKENMKDYKNVHIIHQDFLKANVKEDIDKYFGNVDNIKVIANIPYYITTPILFKLLNENIVSDMYFMVQKELATRLTSKPNCKDYNALSVIMEYKTISKIEFDVPRNFFFPVRNVDSVLLSVKQKKSNYSVNNEGKFVEFLEALFTQKRKTLVNNLSSSKYGLNKEQIKEVLVQVHIKENVRSEELDLEKIIEIYNLLIAG